MHYMKYNQNPGVNLKQQHTAQKKRTMIHYKVYTTARFPVFLKLMVANNYPVNKQLVPVEQPTSKQRALSDCSLPSYGNTTTCYVEDLFLSDGIKIH